MGFIRNTINSWGFTVALYALLAVQVFVSGADFSLSNFSERMIGYSTLQGFDVGARVSLVYYSAGIFFLVAVVLVLLVYFLSRKNDFLNVPEVKIINIASFAGPVLLFFSVMGGNSLQMVLPILFFQLFIFFSGICRRFIFKISNEKVTTELYALATVTGFSLAFAVKEFCVLFSFSFVYGFLHSAFVISFLVSIVLFVALKKRAEAQKLFYGLLPLALIPLISPLKHELYFIFNSHEIYLFTPRNLWLLAILLIIAITTYRFVRPSSLDPRPSSLDYISKKYFPIFLTGIAFFTFYETFIIPSTEMFEYGNRFLPLLELEKYGVIPLVEKFNTHLLSEIFPGLLYTLFHGTDWIKNASQEMRVYDFIFPLLTVVVQYYLILRVSGNAYMALFTTLLFPISSIIVPDYFSVALVGIFLIHAFLTGKKTFLNYVLIFGGVLLFAVWRMDIGAPVILAFILISAVYFLHDKTYLPDRKAIVRVLLLYVALGLGAFCFFTFVRGINIFHNLNSILDFTKETQTYGLLNIANFDTTKARIQLFVFPVFALFAGLYALINFRTIAQNQSQRFTLTAMLFLVVFYLANFHRGLVRHSMSEGTDVFLSSFIFLILGCFVYLLKDTISPFAKHVAFIAITSFFVIAFKYPEQIKHENLFTTLENKFSDFPHVAVEKKKINCCAYSPEFSKNIFEDFKNLCDTHLKAGETFFDFSNSPMLYYYSRKQVPEYFYHHALNTDEMQVEFIKGITNYKVPLVVYSYTANNYWDNVDGVPNTLRNYKIAEYLFQNYEPWIIAQQRCVWKKKGAVLNESRFATDTVSTKAVTHRLGQLPFIWANYDEKVGQAKLLVKLNSKPDTLKFASWLSYELPQNLDKSTGNYLQLKLNTDNAEPFDFRFSFGVDANANGDFIFTVPPGKGERKFVIRISAQYNWYAKPNWWLSMEALSKNDEHIIVNSVELLKGD